jgi:hypothetical protein
MLDEARDPSTGLTKRREMLDNIVSIATTARGPEAIAAARLLWSYDEGLPISRTETGGAGEFQAFIEEVRTALGLKVIK